jgi:hypothetical protein
VLANFSKSGEYQRLPKRPFWRIRVVAKHLPLTC